MTSSFKLGEFSARRLLKGRKGLGVKCRSARAIGHWGRIARRAEGLGVKEGSTITAATVSAMDQSSRTTWPRVAHRKNCIVKCLAECRPMLLNFMRESLCAWPPSYRTAQCVPDAMIGDSCQSWDESFGAIFRLRNRKTKGRRHPRADQSASPNWAPKIIDKLNGCCT